MDANGLSRRRIVQLGLVTAVTIPLTLIAEPACAATNAKVRKALNYQNTPQDGKQCSNCRPFQPGKTPTAEGTCALIPGDTEISPNGYCMAWSKKA
jgi:hypothetical protein